ncbi:MULTISPECIES: LysR family transcriptional regulator [unclassified Variovorax]|uniref:LysR family transcriptional regulator n=1 Tax=unclassified Variovorax TaxID=663243 RepID=UPI000837E0A1|nr:MULTISPECIES: LysR family transcriptional regulator [unclassified Variovorax]PNG52934.1 HTH-type transcriptional regulator CatM [Variovorax sp. B2]PNG53506.1 HTH-type transcriptional regulator CatM [Variovorax sp. B4]VTV10926.1 Cat operon transcriptional regulator [Variovorax sp. WDL1]
MELRQLRYFVRTVELGSIGRAALDLDLVQSALSQQISRLESELATRLLQRTAKGAVPTEAGLAFFREAQLTLRHADQAARVARHARLTGTVSVGLAPTTAAVLAMPFMRAMRERYPDVRLHIVESLSGHLTSMLNARQLDLAVLFNTQAASRWSVMPLLEERLLLIRARRHMAPRAAASKRSISTAQLARLPLILPTGTHGLRSVIDAVFLREGLTPKLVAEIDSLAVLMDTVDAGFGATVQPGAALGRWADAAERFHVAPLADREARRRNAVCSLSDDELSPAAIAVRIVLTDTAQGLVRGGSWPGAALAVAPGLR